MSPRTYRLGKRAAAAEETRGRILAAAHAVFSEAGFLRASLDDVAKRAGVSRATVYNQFESKYKLLDALILDPSQMERARAIIDARRDPDALNGLRRYLAEVCAFWMSDASLFRNVLGLAAVDAAAADLFNAYDDRRHELLTSLVKRLADQGYLRPGVSAKEATDALWLLSSFRSFDQLHVRARLSARQATAVLTRLADSLIEESAEAPRAAPNADPVNVR